MRYLYACFIGYKKFFTGLNAERIEIDFTKCKHNIILITGMNGCGKSTLIEALSPFPDPPSSFLGYMDGYKILTLTDQENLYEIRIESLKDPKGGRKQTKAFVRKNGMELNSTGNINTYKEIIFSEFDLDSNYLSLAKLSSDDRGLADKRPAERKRFVSSIIENLEVYNDIYKSLNKKSLAYKHSINTLHTKIQNIGSKEALEQMLTNLTGQRDQIQERVQYLNNSIIEIQTRNSINEEEFGTVTELEKQKEELTKGRYESYKNLKQYQHITKITPEQIKEKYQSDQTLLSSYQEEYQNANLEWTAKSSTLAALYDKLNELKVNLGAYSSGLDTGIEEAYLESKSKIIQYKANLLVDNVQYDSSYLLYLNSLLEFFHMFIRLVDSFYEDMTPEGLEYVALKFNEDSLGALRKEFERTMDETDDLRNRILTTESKLKIVSVLENRPNECTIDSCPFIVEALQSEEKPEELVDRLQCLQSQLSDLTEKSKLVNELIEQHTFWTQKKTQLDILLREVSKNQHLVLLFRETPLSDLDHVRALLSNQYLFNEYRTLTKWIDLYNTIKQLEEEEKVYSVLEAKYESLKDKMKLVNQTKTQVTDLENRITILTKLVQELRTKKDSYQELCNTLSKLIESERLYVEAIQIHKEFEMKLDEVTSKIERIYSKASNSSKSIQTIQQYTHEMTDLQNKITPMTNQIQTISGQLTLLSSYYHEYDQDSKNYQIIETLKKYCSPTSGGIQTIFMNLYMGKTLSLANQVLGMLFGGQYQLLDFVINQDEFRIPFVGSGLTVDDISSGSTSQICIMGMAINLALLHQASTKYNIARLDEIDSGLDYQNRLRFVYALYHTLPILNIEQLFIISHSVETDTSAVDIIKLRTYDDYSDYMKGGNVIYDYMEEMQKTNK